MSKSVPDQKVEDVLSSVRRLVSSELPRKPRPAMPDGPGALVLTEAHRVETNVSGKQKSHSLEDRIAELEAAVGGQDEEFEPDGSEDQAQHRPDRIVYTRPPSTDEEAAMRRSSVRLSQIALIETGPANDDGETPSDDRSESTPEFRRDAEKKTAKQADEAPMAEDVPTQPHKSAEVRAFTDPDDVVRNIEARIASGRPISEPLPLNDPVVPPKDNETASDDADDFDAALNEAVAASLSSSEADDTADEADDDTSETSDDHAADVLTASEFDPGIFAADTLDPQLTASEILNDPEDSIEPEVKEQPIAADDPSEPKAETASPSEPHKTPVAAETKVQPSETAEVAALAEVETEGQSDQNATTPTGEAVAALAALPDEEAMRLLVSRMIRAELQGELGERITRNVRKLVRREIKRAMTSKDLS